MVAEYLHPTARALLVAVQLPLGEVFPQQVLQHSQHGLQRAGQVLHADRDVHVGRSGVGIGLGVALHLIHQAEFLADAREQAGTQPPAQQLADRAQSVGAIIPQRIGPVGVDGLGHRQRLRRPVERAGRLPAHLQRWQFGHPVPGLHGPELLRHVAQDFVEVEPARQAENHVLRHEEFTVVRLQHGAVEGLGDGRAAPRAGLLRLLLQQQFVHQLVHADVPPVPVAVAEDLLGNDGLLLLQFLRVEKRPEQHVGGNPHHALPVLAVNPEGYVEKLGIGLAVHHTSQVLDAAHDVAGAGEILGPLHQHMLQKVRQAGLLGRLEARPGVDVGRADERVEC